MRPSRQETLQGYSLQLLLFAIHREQNCIPSKGEIDFENQMFVIMIVRFVQIL